MGSQQELSTLVNEPAEADACSETRSYADSGISKTEFSERASSAPGEDEVDKLPVEEETPPEVREPPYE